MKIALLGDIGLFGRNTVQSNWKERFSTLKDVLATYDYVIANLETPLTSETKHVRGKSACIKGNPEDVEILKYIGVTHVSLANNHMYDYKKRGLEDTIRCLEKNKIEWYGIGGKNARISDGNTAINVCGFCCHSTNGKNVGSNSNSINELNPELINDILDQNQRKQELTILSMHWGQEHVHYPNRDHVRLARMFCSMHDGVIIHGHHPHVIQGIESVRGNLIAYSLGNFCFDDVYTKKSVKPLVKMSDDNNESFVLTLDIHDNNVMTHNVIAYKLVDDVYVLDNEIDDRIKEWSGLLNMDESRYDMVRNDFLASYYKNRKRQRDFWWYIKRMNIDSMLLIFGNIRNRKRYKRMVLDYLDKEKKCNGAE